MFVDFSIVCEELDTSLQNNEHHCTQCICHLVGKQLKVVQLLGYGDAK